jgi:hypothetical protein
MGLHKIVIDSIKRKRTASKFDQRIATVSTGI